MTTKFRARFDGAALIPLEPVSFPAGQILTIEAVEAETDTDARARNPQAIVRAMSEPPHLSKEDMEEFERSLAEGQRPAQDGRIFDDEGR